MELPKTSYKETQVNKVNQGTYFKLKPTDTAPVWVRDHYDKSSKTYACHKYCFLEVPLYWINSYSKLHTTAPRLSSKQHIKH